VSAKLLRIQLGREDPQQVGDIHASSEKDRPSDKYKVEVLLTQDDEKKDRTINEPIQFDCGQGGNQPLNWWSLGEEDVSKAIWPLPRPDRSATRAASTSDVSHAIVGIVWQG